ncbi:MAG: ferritin family protein [Fidelibacterota bacterium]
MDAKKLTPFTSIEEILTYAMNEEQEAYDYYIEASNRTSDPDMKAFLVQLAEMEVDHYKILKAKLDEFRANQFSTAGIAASFGSEPSGQ